MGKSAVVTGGGSGIGAALVHALVAAGAKVIAADIDVESARIVAAAAIGPGTAKAVQMDVTDAREVDQVVREVIAEHGGIDLVFANAGITWGGEAELLDLEQWNTIIDVNIRGVVHCIHSAYPAMISAKSGHIIITASMAGLTAAGLLTSYSMTKHAVVGLGLALRSEAAAHGVGVSVLCPAAVDTPILDKGEIGGFDGRYFYLESQGIKTAVRPSDLADRALEAVLENKALVIEPARARFAWRAQRLFPATVGRMTQRFVERQRNHK